MDQQKIVWLAFQSEYFGSKMALRNGSFEKNPKHQFWIELHTSILGNNFVESSPSTVFIWITVSEKFGFIFNTERVHKNGHKTDPKSHIPKAAYFIEVEHKRRF